MANESEKQRSDFVAERFSSNMLRHIARVFAFELVMKHPKVILLSLIVTLGCAGSYVKKVRATEEAFYNGDIDGAVTQITPLAQDSSARDRLLFYMEAGLIYHSKGDLKTSNEIFTRADEMADEIKTSITGSVGTFLLNDREGEFKGENFERILIKYYLALNYTLMGELDNAKRMLRKLEVDLKDMKYEDADYKQVLVARYLDALISEELAQYNDARVQYKNLENFGADAAWLARERYALAAKSRDAGDMAKYAANKAQQLEFPNIRTPQDKKNPGELVVIIETGKAAVKASRGNLMNDREFALALRIAIDVAILSHGKGLSTAGVIAMMGTADNPIPKFAPRENSPAPTLMLEDVTLPQAQRLTDFDYISQRNFNDNYSSYINKNVASIATKIVIAAVAADAAARSIRKSNDGIIGALGGLAVGLGAGAGVAATVKPDLRSWHMLPAGYAVIRVSLPAGIYNLGVQGQGVEGSGIVVYGNGNPQVEIKPGKKTFVSLRSFTRGLPADAK